MPLSEDFDALRLHLVSAVPQFWADRGHYSYLETSRPEDALLFFLPEESGCAFTLRLDSGAVFHPRQGDIFYTPRGRLRWPGNASCSSASLPACTGTFTAPSCFCRPSCMN